MFNLVTTINSAIAPSLLLTERILWKLNTLVLLSSQLLLVNSISLLRNRTVERLNVELGWESTTPSAFKLATFQTRNWSSTFSLIFKINLFWTMNLREPRLNSLVIEISILSTVTKHTLLKPR
jgi:hypothetical protein